MVRGMTKVPHILLLAGSFEARRVAEMLAARGVPYAAWLSEAPRGPAVMPQSPQIRRFADAAEMRSAVAQGRFDAILDASHVFDRTVTLQATKVARALGLPLLRLERPAWRTGGDTGLIAVPDVPAANKMVTKGDRVFCATGWESLPSFASFAGDVLMLRQTRRHMRPPPYPFVDLMFGDPPFSEAAERETFQTLGATVLICRNLGGQASRPKVDAAQALGLKVILVDRPPAPQGTPVVADVQSALDWTFAL